jgi:hypothetical protein
LFTTKVEKWGRGVESGSESPMRSKIKVKKSNFGDRAEDASILQSMANRNQQSYLPQDGQEGY